MAVFCLANAELSGNWTKWKNLHRKKYDAQSQEQVRQSIFEQNLNKINQHNAKKGSFKMSLNAFADKSEQELAALFTTHIDADKVHTLFRNANVSKLAMSRRSARAAVDSVNWATVYFILFIRTNVTEFKLIFVS